MVDLARPSPAVFTHFPARCSFRELRLEIASLIASCELVAEARAAVEVPLGCVDYLF